MYKSPAIEKENKDALFSDPILTLRQLYDGKLQNVDELLLTVGDESLARLIPNINKHVASAGGKRLRPLLALICGELVGCPENISIILAAVVELIHTATLLHDDVIDETTQRRGVKTANDIWGNKACILVGDYQFSQAFRLMLRTECIAVLNLLAETSAKMAEGEVWQLELIGRIDNPLETYIKLVEAKTAALFIAACKSVAIYSEENKLAEITINHIKALEKYGKSLGVLFQIIDDMLDYSAMDSRFGKDTGTDLRERKVTLPVILAYNQATQDDKNILKKIFAEQTADAAMEKEYFKIVQGLLIKYDISTQIHLFLERYTEQGLQALKFLPQVQANSYLQSLLLSASSRAY